ncbi:MAG: helix-turn-helix domain-containing protein, partial [Oscillospiraceae bacterium]|nr:helix-turn-helix domain-containing protein [Oscillospiraceae bacterium]
MEFKDRIKALRVERNMTQSQVAAMLGKSEGAVRAWEIERSKPDIDTLIILAEYFKCTTDYLLGLSDYRNSEEKKEIESLSKDLDEVIAKIDNGRGLLEDLVQFLNLVL